MDDEIQDKIADLSKQGYQLLKESLIERAIESFETILTLQPENNYALVGLGDAYRKQRAYRESIEYYSRCLEYHPANNYALFGLADCYKAQGQFNRAIEIWEEYLKHDDTNVNVLTRVGDAYRKARNLQRSRELYLKVLEIEPTNAYALIGLGHLHYDFKEYRAALDYWLKMEKTGGSHVDIRVLTSLGNCHRKLKIFEKGIPYFLRALDKQPGNFYALFGLADCYRGLNEPAKSLEYWGQILENDPRNKVILTRAGDACRTLGRRDEAVSYYNKALEIEFDIYAALGLAIVDKEQGRIEEALSSLIELMDKEPSNHRLYLEAADCLEQTDRPDEAISMLDKWSELGIHNEGVESYIRRLRERFES